jgi:Domain of unknown function (DUF4189)
MLPKIHSFPQQLIANLRVSEAQVSERCGISRLRTEALLVLLFLIALQPSKSFSEAAFAFGQWGNGGWAYGSAYNHRTQSEAQIAAMNACNQRGYNCAIRGSFRKTCFAIAVQDSNNGWGTGTHGDRDVANRQALLGCARMGLSCAIREEFCDNVSEAEIREAEQAEYRQYLQLWDVCYGKVAGNSVDHQITGCDYALLSPRASQTDRNNLLNRRGMLVDFKNREAAKSAQAALAKKQEDKELVLYEIHWKYCFDTSEPASRRDDQLTSCNYALNDPRLNTNEYSSLIHRRDDLVSTRYRVQDVKDKVKEVGPLPIRVPIEASSPLLLFPDTPAPVFRAEYAFAGLNFLLIRLVIEYLNIAALMVVIGWYGLTRWVRTEVFTPHEVSVIAISAAALCGGGWLFEFLQHQASFQPYAGPLSEASFGAQVFGSSLAALAIGAWVGSLPVDRKLRLGVRALIPIWVIAAATWLALLTREHVYDPFIITGLAYAWTFVLGYVLCDPVINPWIVRLDKLVKRQLSKVTSMVEGLRSPRSQEMPASPQVPVPAEEVIDSWDPGPAGPLDRIYVKRETSQKTSFMGNIVYILDARMEVPEGDWVKIRKHKLGGLVIYDSSDRKRHAEALKAHLERTKEHPSIRDNLDSQLLGIGKTFFRFARAGVSAVRASLSLRITVYSLMSGVHAESEDMDEILIAYEAIGKGAESLRTRLDALGLFENRRATIDEF